MTAVGAGAEVGSVTWGIRLAFRERRQLALVTRAGAAQATRQDLAVIGNEASERAVIFVVDEVHACLAEGTGFLWAAHVLFLVVVVVLIAPHACGSELFFAQLWCSELAVVQRQEVADDAVVELERAVVLWKHGRVGGVAGDDVVALLLPSDGICELAATPVVDFQIGGLAEERVEALETLIDSGIFES